MYIMGISNSLPVRCELCNNEYGELAIFKVYHHGYLGGHNICCVCYPNMNEERLSQCISNNLNKCDTVKQCYCCKYKNKNKLSRRLFKVYWDGKFGNKIMCEKCVYDKNYRNQYINS